MEKEIYVVELFGMAYHEILSTKTVYVGTSFKAAVKAVDTNMNADYSVCSFQVWYKGKLYSRYSKDNQYSDGSWKHEEGAKLIKL